jgi:hypothetical protein
MKHLRLSLVPTDRSDLVCVACSGFKTDFAILIGGEPSEFYGMHKKCISTAHAKRAKNIEKEIAT